MTNSENERIAHLTGNAIRMSSDSVVKEITDAVVAAERVAGDLRVEGDQLTAEIRRQTEDLIERINEFVLHCQSASEKMREVRSNRSGMMSDIDKVNLITSSLPSLPERATMRTLTNGESTDGSMSEVYSPLRTPRE